MKSKFKIGDRVRINKNYDYTDPKDPINPLWGKIAIIENVSFIPMNRHFFGYTLKLENGEEWPKWYINFFFNHEIDLIDSKKQSNWQKVNNSFK